MAHGNYFARRQLDQRLDTIRPLTHTPRPHRGWIRAIRDALGMSGSELADRMGISPKTIPDIERSEVAETIKLETLRRAANALDCELAYVLVPRTSLDTMVTVQARRKALRHLDPVAHHGFLEDQGVSDEGFEDQISELAERFVDKRGLWKVETLG
jgi:predicted DNA-binding mobile mystery protein A